MKIRMADLPPQKTASEGGYLFFAFFSAVMNFSLITMDTLGFLQ
jgi:hypothetical protein